MAANQMYNVSLGKVAEYVSRVNLSDPTNAVILVDLLQTSGIETDAVLKDKTTFTDLVSGATNFATGTGWNRKSLDQSAGLTVTVDHTNDRTDVDMPDQTWTAVDNAASDVSAFVTGYDSDSTAGTDANVIPMTQHDFVIQPDGSDVTAQIAAAGFFRAQ